MAEIIVGWDGAGGDNTHDIPTASPRGVKVPVGAAAGLICNKFRVKTKAGTGAGIMRVLVYDDDGATAKAGTLLATGCIGVPATTSAIYTGYFTDGFTMPESGSVWIYGIQFGGASTIDVERKDATIATACHDATANMSYTVEANNPTTADAGNRDIAMYLVVDDLQPFIDFVGDNISHINTGGSNNNRMLALSRFPVSADEKALTYTRLVWNRALDAFGTAKVRAVVYADDPTDDLPGVLIASAGEILFGAAAAYDGAWDEIIMPSPFDLSLCTDYVFVGFEADGGDSVLFNTYCSEEGGTEGYRISTGLAAWSDVAPPADVSALVPHTASSVDYAVAMGLLAAGGADSAGGGGQGSIAAASSAW